MQSSYTEYKDRIDSVRYYVKTLRNIAEIPSRFPDEYSAKELRQFVSMPEKKEYDYCLVIILLYGITESFIEDIASAYLHLLNDKIKKYTNLPSIIAHNHVELSAKLINNASLKYSAITNETIISNLHSCLNQSDGAYKLNIEAFTQHTSNFRIDVIQTFFQSVGIENIKELLKTSAPLKDYLIEAEGISPEESDSMPDAKYFEILEDLVQRRNVIAHGSKIDDRLSLELLDTYSHYISAFIESIYLCVVNKYYRVLVEKGVAQRFGKAYEVIDNRIVCINSSKLSLKIGQLLIGENGKRVCVGGTIDSMQLNGKDINEIKAGVGVDVGIKVSFKAKDNYIYYLVPDD